MGMFVVVGALWAAIGYVYSDKSVASAAVWGGIVVGVGWFVVACAVSIKYLRIMARRRRSNDPAAGR